MRVSGTPRRSCRFPDPDMQVIFMAGHMTEKLPESVPIRVFRRKLPKHPNPLAIQENHFHATERILQNLFDQPPIPIRIEVFMKVRRGLDACLDREESNIDVLARGMRRVPSPTCPSRQAPAPRRR